MRRSVVLVGLMGAGKTSVGRRLAEILDVPFHDSDVEIEAASAGMSIPEIFERYGEPEFRRLEREVLKRLLSGPPAVIATGGGAFMNGETRDAIARAGVSVWLDAPIETLWSRIGQRPGRPLLQVEDPRAVLAALMKERAPIYALADITLPCGARKNQESVARGIVQALKAHDAKAPERAVLAAEGLR